MPLTATQAAEIARRHGLGLPDAVSLQALTDDPIEANEVAQRFAADLPRTGSQVVRSLFGESGECRQLPDAPDAPDPAA